MKNDGFPLRTLSAVCPDCQRTACAGVSHQLRGVETVVLLSSPRSSRAITHSVWDQNIITIKVQQVSNHTVTDFSSFDPGSSLTSSSSFVAIFLSLRFLGCVHSHPDQALVHVASRTAAAGPGAPAPRGGRPPGPGVRAKAQTPARHIRAHAHWHCLALLINSSQWRWSMINPWTRIDQNWEKSKKANPLSG